MAGGLDAIGVVRDVSPMSVLWPETRNPDPTVITRLGRVLHWSATIVAGLWAVACLYGAATTQGGDAGSLIGGLVVVVVFGGAIYFAGRGARYILSGE